MALQNLVVATILCFLVVIVIEPDRVYGSSRDPISLAAARSRSGRSNKASSPVVGVCQSLVTVHGYKCQEFNVRTDDGYVLSLQRISEGRAGSSGGGGGTNKQPVLLQHGLLVMRNLGAQNSPKKIWIYRAGCLANGPEKWAREIVSLPMWRWISPSIEIHDGPAKHSSQLDDSTHRKRDKFSHLLGEINSIFQKIYNSAEEDGASWLLNSPEQSLGFILADSGFDVWIANTRGTRFSRSHATLDASDPAYWNWSWDELVQFDLPATFDFVYGQTGQKFHYVGHSLGTLVALASFSQGKLVDKVRSAALLSPVAYLSHITTALVVLAADSFIGEIGLIGIPEFNPNEEIIHDFLKSLCSNLGIDCYDLLAAVTGKNCCLNSSTVDIFLTNEPQSTATKNLVHLSQMVRDGVVAKYDYENPYFNVQHYGQPRPPIYNLTNIPKNLPLFMSYGGQDSLADTRDVGLLLNSLKFHDGDKLTVQFVKDYAHADFIMGVSAKEVVYNAMTAFFRRQP